MATVPVQKPKKFQSKQEAAAAMARLIEEHMEEQGWSEEEKDRRVQVFSDDLKRLVPDARSK